MSIEYMGNDELGRKMAEKLNKAFSRGHVVSTSSNQSRWPVCKKCGKHVMSLFEDTMCCSSCDEEFSKDSKELENIRSNKNNNPELEEALRNVMSEYDKTLKGLSEK